MKSAQNKSSSLEKKKLKHKRQSMISPEIKGQDLEGKSKLEDGMNVIENIQKQKSNVKDDSLHNI